MNLQEINQKIKSKEEAIQNDSKMMNALNAMKSYSGIDKIISSEEAMEAIKNNNLSERKNYYSKLLKLDDLTGGFRGGQLIVLSAPTGQGKTQFLQNLTHNFADQDIPCLWFSYEMGQEELFDRFGGEVPSFYLPSKMKESSMEWLKMRVLEGIAKHDTKVIFIDHLHFLLEMGDMAKTHNLSILIGMMMRELKKIAIATDTIIFLVSHMGKSMLEKKAPSIEDLRDSSFVAQESDIVMMLWREKMNDTLSPTGWSFTNQSNLIVVKNRRTGKLGSVKMVFNNGKFIEL